MKEPAPLPVPVAVTPELLRRLFDAMQIFEKLHDGFFTARLFWQSNNSPAHLSVGSVSQMWEYLTSDGVVFARLHQYRNRSGESIGRPDPKYLRLNQVALYTTASR